MPSPRTPNRRGQALARVHGSGRVSLWRRAVLHQSHTSYSFYAGRALRGLDDYSQRPGEGDVQEGGQAQRDGAFCWRQPSRCLFGKTAHFLRN